MKREKERKSMGGFGRYLAMDIGAANAVVGEPGRGVVLRGRAAVMTTALDKRVLAVGDEAWNAHERTPDNLAVCRPLAAPCDFDVLTPLLAFFRQKANPSGFIVRFLGIRPRALFAVPPCATAFERRAYADAARAAGFSLADCGVALVDETLAHAVGTGLWRRPPGCSAALVVGARCCHAAVFSDGEVALSRCIHSRTPLLGAGGDAMDAAIVEFFERESGLVVGTEYAERIKRSAGVSPASGGYGEVEPPPGCKMSVSQAAAGVRDAMSAPLARLCAMFGELLEDAARELGDGALSEIADGGVMLSGGGAQLRGLDDLLRDKFKMPFTLAERPLDSAVDGMLEMIASRRIPALEVEATKR